MAAVCCSGHCSRTCNYYPVRNYRSSNKYKNIACVCVCVCVCVLYVCLRAWLGAVNNWLLTECRSFFTITSDWIFTSCVCRGNEEFISMCVGGECLRLDSIYFSRSNFLLVTDYGPLHFVLFIRNLLLICKIILTEGAGLHHRYIIQRNHTESDYNDWVIFFFFAMPGYAAK